MAIDGDRDRRRRRRSPPPGAGSRARAPAAELGRGSGCCPFFAFLGAVPASSRRSRCSARRFDTTDGSSSVPAMREAFTGAVPRLLRRVAQAVGRVGARSAALIGVAARPTPSATLRAAHVAAHAGHRVQRRRRQHGRRHPGLRVHRHARRAGPRHQDPRRRVGLDLYEPRGSSRRLLGSASPSTCTSRSR